MSLSFRVIRSISSALYNATRVTSPNNFHHPQYYLDHTSKQFEIIVFKVKCTWKSRKQKMVNYQLGKIYKIVDLSTYECYVGSTCQPTLAKRLQGHVRQYRQYSKGKMRFTTSFLIIANNNYDIELIEDYPCDSKVELHKRERYHTTSRACVNKNKNQGLIAELG